MGRAVALLIAGALLSVITLWRLDGPRGSVQARGIDRAASGIETRAESADETDPADVTLEARDEPTSPARGVASEADLTVEVRTSDGLALDGAVVSWTPMSSRTLSERFMIAPAVAAMLTESFAPLMVA